nr:mitogen-activated protein kinase-binding protein 1 [Quercus suber]
MNPHPSLRLTPSTSHNNSPFFKNNTAPRSPGKQNKSEEPGLHLRKVIGTTTASPNGFDCLPATRKFAYIAGAAAVVATLELDLKVTQQFFRARPTASTGTRDGSTQWPASPAANEARLRGVGNLREQGLAGSPLHASGRDWLDSPTSKSLTAKDRIKAATAVALSPNGKWLAIGETGYRPRILIFPIGDEVSETPAACVAEHSFGVHALAFSPNSRYLASLGTINDGFLYVWSIDDRTGTATLHASNKCTSTINCMEWLGRSIVTAGLRFIKLWRPDEDANLEHRSSEQSGVAGGVVTPRSKTEPRLSEFTTSILNPRHKVLAGKNSLLGDMLENFVCLVPINESKAIVCAEIGEICILDDTARTQILIPVHTTDFRISAARLDNQGQVHVAGTAGESKSFSLVELERARPLSSKQGRRRTLSLKSIQNPSRIITAMATIGNVAVELDAQRSIRLSESTNCEEHATEAFSHQLPAHQDAVLGVRCLSSETVPDAAFLTYSGNGTIQLWNAKGILAAKLIAPIDTSPDMYGISNELRAVADLAKGALLAAGDKYGTLTVLDVKSAAILAQVRAHSSEITDVTSFEDSGATFIVTASRDRTIQLFAWHSQRLDLLQTMDEHAAAVTGLLITSDQKRLLSCSTDRSVAVREAMVRDERDPLSVAFVFVRALTLKSSPTSMCFASQPDVILIAAMDKTIGSYNIKSGQAGFGFKCSDAESGEAAIASRVLYAPSLNGNPTIMAASSSDKSIRLYSEFGTLIARDWGHTEGITDIALLPNTASDSRSSTLITVAADSTIFLWDTTPAPPAMVRHQTEPTEVVETPAKPIIMRPPLRKVMSNSELSLFKRRKSIEADSPSPPGPRTPSIPPSPHRLRKKTSRMNVAQAPKLEPTFRTNFESSRRQSMRNRSPSPPSPRNVNKKTLLRRPSLGGVTLRSKSSENVLHPPMPSHPNPNTGFGSITTSTDSVCRTLRAYRKRLVNAPAQDPLTPESLRELEKELKLTARVLSEKSQGKSIDEAMMARLLDQASEKIVGMLDERIKERVESEVRRSADNSPASSVPHLIFPPPEGGAAGVVMEEPEQEDEEDDEVEEEAQKSGGSAATAATVPAAAAVAGPRLVPGSLRKLTLKPSSVKI